jgi:hypothetical protein
MTTWRPEDHPRHPAGSEQGGEFASTEGGTGGNLHWPVRGYILAKNGAETGMIERMIPARTEAQAKAAIRSQFKALPAYKRENRTLKIEVGQPIDMDKFVEGMNRADTVLARTPGRPFATMPRPRKRVFDMVGYLNQPRRR